MKPTTKLALIAALSICAMNGGSVLSDYETTLGDPAPSGSIMLFTGGAQINLFNFFGGSPLTLPYCPDGPPCSYNFTETASPGTLDPNSYIIVDGVRYTRADNLFATIQFNGPTVSTDTGTWNNVPITGTGSWRVGLGTTVASGSFSLTGTARASYFGRSRAEFSSRIEYDFTESALVVVDPPPPDPPSDAPEPAGLLAGGLLALLCYRPLAHSLTRS